VTVFLDEDGFIPSLKEMADPPVPFVEFLSVDAIQLPHAEGEIALRRFDDKVKVVIHEAIGMAEPIVAFIDLVESREKVLSICLILVNRLLFISPGGYVIHSPGIFDA